MKVQHNGREVTGFPSGFSPGIKPDGFTDNSITRKTNRNISRLVCFNTFFCPEFSDICGKGHFNDPFFSKESDTVNRGLCPENKAVHYSANKKQPFNFLHNSGFSVVLVNQA